jgi:prepilin-type N-terminal cleavage/methylation domain-containing protein
VKIMRKFDDWKLKIGYSCHRQEGFTLMELLVVMVIIGILAGIVGSNFVSSQMKGRDTKRKSDLAQIAKAVEFYTNDHGNYPEGISGSIYGCGTEATAVCVWGEKFYDGNETVDEADDTIYMGELPKDVSSGRSYYYMTSADKLKFWLYARLENEKDINLNFDDDGNVLYYSGTDCGGGDLCNYGISSPNTTPEEGAPLI